MLEYADDSGPHSAPLWGGVSSSLHRDIAQEYGLFVSESPLCLGSSQRSQTPRMVPEPVAQDSAPGQQRRALLLFGDEASFAQWGSLSYTWAPKGQQPEVPTSGKRKAYKVFGLIDYFSGRFFYKAHAGRFNSASYAAFLLDVLSQTTEPVVVIQDGARYHTSKAMQAFFEAHADRLTIEQLPAYSPDFNPIEHLWKKVKKEATHLKYFPA